MRRTELLKEIGNVNMYHEKSGVIVLMQGKTLEVFDGNGTKVGQLVINHDTWPIREPRPDTHFGIV